MREGGGLSSRPEPKLEAEARPPRIGRSESRCRPERALNLTSTAGSLDGLCMNTIRTLSIDSVEKAASGHPGLAIGSPTTADILWTQHLRRWDSVAPNGTASAGHDVTNSGYEDLESTEECDTGPRRRRDQPLLICNTKVLLARGSRVARESLHVSAGPATELALDHANGAPCRAGRLWSSALTPGEVQRKMGRSA